MELVRLDIKSVDRLMDGEIKETRFHKDPGMGLLCIFGAFFELLVFNCAVNRRFDSSANKSSDFSFNRNFDFSVRSFDFSFNRNFDFSVNRSFDFSVNSGSDVVVLALF